MKKFNNYLSFKLRRALSRKDYELQQLVKDFTKTWNSSSAAEVADSLLMSNKIAIKNEEIAFIQQQWLKSKYYSNGLKGLRA